jgi:hypothetical protein
VSPSHCHVAVVRVLLTSFTESPCGTYALDTTEVAPEFWFPVSTDVRVRVPLRTRTVLAGQGRAGCPVGAEVRTGARKVFTARALGVRLPAMGMWWVVMALGGNRWMVGV